MTLVDGQDWTAARAADLDSRLNALEVPATGGEVVGNVPGAGPFVSGTSVLSFGSVTRSPVNIGWNGVDTWTIQQDGVYRGFVQARIVVASMPTAQPAIHVTGTTYSDATLLFPGSSYAGYGDMELDFVGFLTVGQKLQAWIYSGQSWSLHSARNPMFKLWRVA